LSLLCSEEERRLSKDKQNTASWAFYLSGLEPIGAATRVELSTATQPAVRSTRLDSLQTF